MQGDASSAQLCCNQQVVRVGCSSWPGFWMCQLTSFSKQGGYWQQHSSLRGAATTHHAGAVLCCVVLCHRFTTFGKEGVIDVNGPAEVTPTAAGERIKATFTEAELKWNGLT